MMFLTIIFDQMVERITFEHFDQFGDPIDAAIISFRVDWESIMDSNYWKRTYTSYMMFLTWISPNWEASNCARYPSSVWFAICIGMEHS